MIFKFVWLSFGLRAASAGQAQHTRSFRQTRRHGDVEKPPNIIWIFTDDQDQLLGGGFPTLAPNGATPMPKTKELMYHGGTYAEHFYTHTPICTPARAQLFTGRYFHNIKKTNLSLWSMHVDPSIVEEKSFFRQLQRHAGYRVGLFGKYLNVMPEEVPPGFDAWFANTGSSYVAPKFQVKNIDGLADGNIIFDSNPANYSTSLIGNTSIAWIKKVAKMSEPFLAYIAPKAPHEPFNPAVWYRDYWDPSWPDKEPVTHRQIDTEMFAEKRDTLHLTRLFSGSANTVMTDIFKNRWRTLMSVDDLVSDVIKEIESLGISDRTYVFFSSDNGFHLGQYNNLMDKRHVYEWDTKIPLLARGPGIRPGSVMRMAGTNVDIAPTLLGLAGLPAPPFMDGRSIVPFLLDSHDDQIPWTVQQHLRSLGDSERYKKKWRTEVFFEHYFVDENIKCLQGCQAKNYPETDSMCGNLANNSNCWCNFVANESDCYVTETTENNFIALRDVANHSLYAEFQNGSQVDTDIGFDRLLMTTHYTIWPHRTEHMLQRATTGSQDLRALHRRLRRWFTCAGASCP